MYTLVFDFKSLLYVSVNSDASIQSPQCTHNAAKAAQYSVNSAQVSLLQHFDFEQFEYLT